MFDRDYMRLWIALGWILLFGLMWGVFEYTISGDTLLSDLEELENSISAENWTLASQQFQTLEEHWEQNKVPIQANNASNEVTRFTTLLNQAKTLIHYKEDDALIAVSEMKGVSEAITKVFPSP